MAAPDPARDTDWLRICRRATSELRGILRDRPTTAERVREVGTRGEGGDRTLLIDAAAEDAVFNQLAGLHDQGLRFTAVSEERGTVDFGGTDTLVVVDPIDGSVNAKRGLPHHSISIAVADGGTMEDVFFGYVHDFGPGEEWVARRGQGAWLDGRRLDRRRASAAAPTASSSCSASSPPTRAGSATRRTRSPSAPTACARSGRSPSRSARSPPRGSTAWSRCGAAARSTPPPAS